MNIFAFGDSITYGAWDSQGGWVQRLRRELEARDKKCLVYNLGVSGETSQDVLVRAESEIESRYDADDETIVFFGVGMNDAVVWHGREHQHWVPPGDYQRNLSKLAALGRKFTEKVAFVSLTPIDEQKTNPSPWDTSASYLEQHIREYQKLLETSCNSLELPCVDVYTSLSSVSRDEILEDGLHPNDRGHERITKELHAFLERMSWV